MGDGPRSYSDEEVEAILRRALERQAAEGDGHGHEDLVAAAREVGLDDGAIERAVAEIRAEREVEEIRVARTRHKRAGWLRHLAVYAVLVGGLLGLYGLGLVGALAIGIAVAWGSGLALHGLAALRGATPREVARERARRAKKARRAAREKAHREAERRRREAEAQAVAEGRPPRGDAASAALEEVVEEGVALLLGAAAKKLREASARLEETPPRAPEGEFAKYVARQRGEVASEPSRSRASPAQVRVDAAVEAPPAEVESSTKARDRRRRVDR